MTDTLFTALDLPDHLLKAVEAMGFTTATPVQAQTIPLIRSGADLIAQSQTGTGKTVAFSVPALERIDTKEDKATVQALILCPTRELAQQAGDEIRKLAKFMPGIRPVDIYGGTDMERQFIRLRRANIVVGTPGRVLDHMRRRTLKLESLKLLVLDEADEMLNMGFKEELEAILEGTPDQRQTVLFSATMPPAIRTLAEHFLHEPQTVQIDKTQVTIEAIEQTFVEAPQARKNDALTMLLRYHRPHRALVFCNTKRMVDELALFLNQKGFAAESIHGDLSQAQRTSVMGGFKGGRVSILVATDVAARGIDVSGLDYVFNYDIPMTAEYYVHRIGRTGRAGKAGCAITLCCGKRQVHVMRGFAKLAKATLTQTDLPTLQDIAARELERSLEVMEAALAGELEPGCEAMAAALIARGHAPERIAAAALTLHFPAVPADIPAIPVPRKGHSSVDDREPRRPEKGRPARPTNYTELLFNIGSANRVAPNHLVGAITERSGISGKDVGKIQIYPDYSVVSVPRDMAEEILVSMRGCKICGKPTYSERLADMPEPVERPVRALAGRAVKARSTHAGDPVRRRRK